MKSIRSLILGLAAIAAISLAAPLSAAPEGMVVTPTKHSYQELIDRLDEAAAKHKMGIVSRASATIGAKKVLDKTIPGNMVVGVYHPRFAVRMLEASIPAGIEAPIRFYITENEDGTATLRYRKPSAVFAPYDDGGEALDELAAELDEVFAAIAADATGM